MEKRMSKKGQTQALSASVRNAREKRKAVAQLRDLLVCVEFYHDHRADYTHSEMDKLDKAVQIQRDSIQKLTV